MKTKLSKKEKIIYSISFILFALLNIILVLNHEPWRDEIHAWLMAKTYSIPQLFIASNYDGHPILWHSLLMPFAKLNFPIITLNIISYIIVLISAYIFLFKTTLPIWVKLICLFTIPFTYTYSVISRNYCLILLILMLIAILYPKRYDKPILYSILICFLIHTHTLSWGIVAGLTITFHFIEIYKHFKYKNVKNIKSIIFGLSLIVINTLIVVIELYGSQNTDVVHFIYDYIIYVIQIFGIITTLLLVNSIWLKKYWKEFTILFISFAFQIWVYTCVYSSVLYQRLILIFILCLFYILLISSNKEIEKRKMNIICIFYCILIFMFAIPDFITYVYSDFTMPYTSAQEMAIYINENIPESTTIYIDAAIIGQTMIPYLDTATFYDITYDHPVDCANTSNNQTLIHKSLQNISQYSGNYLIICNNIITLDNEQAKLIYETKTSITNELFSLYYIY